VQLRFIKSDKGFSRDHYKDVNNRHYIIQDGFQKGQVELCRASVDWEASFSIDPPPEGIQVTNNTGVTPIHDLNKVNLHNGLELPLDEA